MMLSRDQEIEELEKDILAATRALLLLERAPHEGRWTRGDTEWMDACANAQTRIDVLRADLADLRLAEALEGELA